MQVSKFWVFSPANNRFGLNVNLYYRRPATQGTTQGVRTQGDVIPPTMWYNREWGQPACRRTGGRRRDEDSSCDWQRPRDKAAVWRRRRHMMEHETFHTRRTDNCATSHVQSTTSVASRQGEQPPISFTLSEKFLPKTQNSRLEIHMMATEPSRRLLHLFGTVCRSQYAHRRHCKFFAADWRPNFLPGRTAALTKSVSLQWLPRDFTVILTCYVSLQS